MTGAFRHVREQADVASAVLLRNRDELKRGSIERGQLVQRDPA